MINIPRTVLRDCRAVFRRAGARSGASLFDLIADKHGVRIRSVQDDVRVEYHHPTPTESASFMLPMELLADCEGKDPGVVQFQAQKNGNVEVCWERSGVPCRRQYLHGQTTQKPFPTWPSKATTNNPSLLDALDQAMQIIGKDTVHRGINFLQLRGARGDIVASDGRQLLVQCGYQWPWKEPLLVPRTNVFGSCELACGSSIMTASTSDHVLFRTGPWTIAMRIETAAHYPSVDSLIPRVEQATTHWTIDVDEREPLGRVLSELPAAKEDYAPVTLDLNGTVAIRAMAEGESRCTEVRLPRSHSDGAAMRLATNRTFLQRALQLGFGKVYLFDPTKPILFQDERRVFIWVPLGTDSTIAPQRSPIRVSLDSVANPTRVRTRTHSSHAPAAACAASATDSQAATPAYQSKPRVWNLAVAAASLWSFIRKFRHEHEKI